MDLATILASLGPYLVGAGGVLAFLIQWRTSSQNGLTQLWAENRALREEITRLRVQLASLETKVAVYEAERTVDEETLIARIKTECPGDWRLCPLLPARPPALAGRFEGG